MLKEKIDTDGLLTEFIEQTLAGRITDGIKKVVSGILSGAIQSGIRNKAYGDATAVEQYLRALRQLLKTIPSPDEIKTA